MQLEENVGFYMKEKELYLLLAGKGVSQWYGIMENQRITIDSIEEIYKILTELYQKAYIDWEKEMVVINEPIKSIITFFQETDYCMIAKTQNDVKNKIYYFAPNRVVVMEKSQREEEMLKFTLLSCQNFINSIWEDGIFPSEELIGTLEEVEEENIYEGALQATDESEKNQIKNERQLILVNIHNGESIEIIGIEEAGIKTYITFEKENKKERQLYNKEWCEKKIKQWIYYKNQGGNELLN